MSKSPYHIDDSYIDEAQRLFDEKQYGELYLLCSRNNLGDVLIRGICSAHLAMPEELIVDLRNATMIHGLKDICVLIEKTELLSKLINMTYFKLDYYWSNHTTYHVINELMENMFEIVDTVKNPKMLILPTRQIDDFDDYYNKGEYLKVISYCKSILNAEKDEDNIDYEKIYLLLCRSYESVDLKQLKRFLQSKAKMISNGLMRLRERLVYSTRMNISRIKQTTNEYDCGIAELVGLKYNRHEGKANIISDSKHHYGDHPSQLYNDKPYQTNFKEIRTQVSTVMNILSEQGPVSWKEVSIARISDDSILIRAGSFSEKYTFSELGLKDRRKGDMPNRIWQLLMVLASSNGHIPYDRLTLDLRKKIEKSISDLRGFLKTLTGLHDDPIYRFSKKRGYLSKFKISDNRAGTGTFQDNTDL